MINLIEVDLKKPLIYYESELVKEIILNDEYLYKLEETVTYKVDTYDTYTETYSYGEDVLSPVSFYPMKEGWEFIGWREDTEPETFDILQEKKLGLEPITLYAVFKKYVNCTFISYGDVEMKTGIAWYNNGNRFNAFVVAPSGSTYPGWTFLGWDNVVSATSHPRYLEDKLIGNISDDITYYGNYSREITLTYNANGGVFDNGQTTRKEVDIMYWNAYGNSLPASFYLPNNEDIIERENYIYKGWELLGEKYIYPMSNIGDNIVSLSYDATCYAIWEYDPPPKPENPGSGGSGGSSEKDFSGELYCWNGPEDTSKWYGSGYSEYEIYVHATKDNEDGKDPIEDGGTIYWYGYVELVGTNGKKERIVGNQYVDKEGRSSGSLSKFGGSFYVCAKGYAGEVDYEGTLYK